MAKRRSAALVRAEKAAQTARRRAAAIRKRYNKPPIQKIATVAAGGAAVALVDSYVPQEYQEIAGLPVSAIIGIGLAMTASFQKGKNSDMMFDFSAGMLACAARDFTKTQLA